MSLMSLLDFLELGLGMIAALSSGSVVASYLYTGSGSCTGGGGVGTGV